MDSTLQWSPRSWRSHPVQQQVDYPDPGRLAAVENILSSALPIVGYGEIMDLRRALEPTVTGSSFLVQGGDCAEAFDHLNVSTISSALALLLKLSIILTHGSDRQTVLIGRIAGQYAKPRSSPTEEIEGVILPSYRGDIINGYQPNLVARTPDPDRMLTAYMRAVSTANLARQLHSQPDRLVRQKRLVEDAYRNVMGGAEGGTNSAAHPFTPIYFSHEALLLPFEEMLTRFDDESECWYGSSGHMLWIGDRTRGSDDAHVEFVSGIANPIGIKCGPSTDPDELLRILHRLNPTNAPGRIILIVRMGASRIGNLYPALLRRMRAEGVLATWSCDPMHGNTFTASNGYKTRDFSEISREAADFFEIHDAESVPAGGVHLEMSAQRVTECVGGKAAIDLDRLSEDYQTLCDPRLNLDQTLEFACGLAKRLACRSSEPLPATIRRPAGPSALAPHDSSLIVHADLLNSEGRHGHL
ncbi:3-deoxy-7-phosphoheptulonate synthase [Sphingobium sp.]|uniref:3-deoxy-7-phosphoheptulonate synthase n=1 Tax=Sphingobium sp. TaxID=1912891 RepID=UPI000DB026AA|nr:3-deoxy-7-phosphoheptulonate synthase [Sphingobium sp.]PZU64145.1 MAG: 3-deoxy-7-phosphoheptulonate synthase class II [Sphingobium sp.]